MKRFLQILFFVGVIKPLILVILGLRISNKRGLPLAGPAILVANHNSHLDTMVLMTLFPLRLLAKVRPVAAADYFLSNPLLAWIGINLFNILPIHRQPLTSKQNPLLLCLQSLQKGEILIVYPEGSRGEPEQLSKFKSGVAYLAKHHPQVPIYPIFLHGLGKALPKGDLILVPFYCDIFIGEPIGWTGQKQTFMQLLNQRMVELASQGHFPAWD